MSCRDAWIDMLRATRCSGVRVELPSPAQIPQSSHPYLYFRNTFKDCRLLLKQLWLAFGLVKVPGHLWWWRALILKSSCAREKFNLHLVTFPFCCKGMGRYIYIYIYVCIFVLGCRDPQKWVTFGCPYVSTNPTLKDAPQYMDTFPRHS